MAPRTQLKVEELDTRTLPAVGMFRSANLAQVLTTAAAINPNPATKLMSAGEIATRVLPGASLNPVPLATTPPALGTPTTTTTPTTQTGTHPLEGLGQGMFTNPAIPGALTVDALTTYNLTGTANLAAMGQVKVTGTVRAVGWVLTGQATGQLTFSNNRGSVTVALLGPVQAGFSAPPQAFAYKVVARTGAFAHLNDHGTLGLAIAPQTFNYVPQPYGNFALVI